MDNIKGQIIAIWLKYFTRRLHFDLDSFTMHKIWRDGRAAEGAPLLREYGVCSLIEGSNPSLSAILFYGYKIYIVASMVYI